MARAAGWDERMDKLYRVVEIAALVGCMAFSGLSAYQSISVKSAIAEAKLELMKELVTRREFDAHVYRISNGRPD